MSLKHRADDFSFILNGLIGIFQEQMSSMHPLLPGSKKPVPYIVETGVYTPVCHRYSLTCPTSDILLEDD